MEAAEKMGKMKGVRIIVHVFHYSDHFIVAAFIISAFYCI